MDRSTRVRKGQIGDASVEPIDLEATGGADTGQVPSLGGDGKFLWIDPIPYASEIPTDETGITVQDWLDSLEGVKHTQNTDTGTNQNDFLIGDGADSDKDITANNGDENKPKLRYDAETNKWQYSNNGVDFSDIGTSEGASALSDLTDVDFDTGTPIDGQVLTYDTVSGKWKAEEPTGGGTASEISTDETGVTVQDWLDSLEGKSHTAGSDTSLGALASDINMNTHQVTALSVPDANGEAIRQTTKITEVSLEDAIDKKHDEITADNFTIINTANTIKVADRIEGNIMLLAFYRCVDMAKSFFNLIDGFIDEYEDETGIDTVNSLNEVYDSVNDLYSPLQTELEVVDYMEYASNETAQSAYVTDDTLDTYTKLMLHGDGSNLSTTITDEIGKTVTNADDLFDTYTKLCSHFDGANNATAYTDPIAGAYTFGGGAKLSTVTYKWTSSLYLDGTGDYVTLPTSGDWDWGTGAFTIDAWVYPEDLLSVRTIISNQYYDVLKNGNWALIINPNGSVGFATWDGQASLESVTSGAGEVVAGSWQHIAVVGDGAGAVTIYVDGVSVATGAVTKSLGDTTPIIEIGSIQSGTDQFFYGYIDEVRISKGIARWTTTFTPPVAPYGQVVISTSQKKFGTGSLLFDGSGSYLSLADSADWDFGTGDFTIDCWVYFNSVIGNQTIISQLLTNNNILLYMNSTAVVFQSQVAGVMKGQYAATNLTFATGQWYHIVFERTTTTAKIFVNGVSQSLTEYVAFGTNALADVGAALQIGYFAVGAEYYFNGYIDELKISKGVARWTENFTPSISEYPNNPQVYSEDTIKTQGSYSLKGIGAITGSLNKTLTRTIGSPINLSGIDSLKFDIRSNRIGSNIKVGIHDVGGTTTEITPEIETGEVDTFKTVTWDISGVTDANKDAIDQIIVTIVNADAENTFYIDNFYSPAVKYDMTLISNDVTAEAEPTTVRVVVFEQDVDAITINTDLKLWVSIDSGATYDQVTLADEGDWETGKRILSGIVDVTARTGTAILYKITTHNEKALKIHGTACSWA